MDITRWLIPTLNWLYSLQPKMEKLYWVSKHKTGSWLWLRSWTPYCQIQTYTEESRKTTRPFKYDLNQISYDYTVEVTNRFMGLDLIECLTNYGWRFMTLYRRQGSRSSPRGEKMNKGKMVIWGDLKNSCVKKRRERQRRKGKIYPFECRVPKKSEEK